MFNIINALSFHRFQNILADPTFFDQAKNCFTYPLLKKDGISLLILFLVEDFKEKEIYFLAVHIFSYWFLEKKPSYLKIALV